jgi:hypothetical protein
VNFSIVKTGGATNQFSPAEPRSGEFAFPPTSRAKTVERRGRVDCNGDIRAWQDVNSRAM